MQDWIDQFLQSGAIISAWNGRVIVGFGSSSTSSEPPAQGISFFFPDFFLTNPTWVTYKETRELSLQELAQLVSLEEFSDRNTTHWHHPHQPLFCEQFQHLQHKFSSGELIKAVPFVIESAPEPLSREQLVRSLKSAITYLHGRKGYLYGFWNQKEGMLGVTPELLLHAKRGEHLHISTCACAGTSKFGQDPQRLLNDPKERREHQIVVEGITEALAPMGNVSLGSIELLKFGAITHLFTPIQACLDAKLAFVDVLTALHPTPALGAFPKKAGEKWLKEYQALMDRKRYGAPVGYMRATDSEAVFYVAIRNVQWDQHSKYVAAGCGVVAESCSEEEWKEIQLKLHSIKEMLNL